MTAQSANRTWASDPAAWLNIAIKVALLVSFAIAIFATPDVVAGKNMGARAPLFLAPAIIVPIIGRVRRWSPYPHLADALLSVPFLLDTLGNLLGFYNDYGSTDDVLHFINWVFLVMAFHAFRYRTVNDHRDAIFIGYGFGAIAIIVWEAFEWLISDAGPFAGGVPDALSLTYGDTVGDLVISSTGGLIGSLIGRYWSGRHVDDRHVEDRHVDDHHVDGRQADPL